MDAILFVAYIVLGYWAVGQTIYANKILIGTTSAIMTKKLVLGMAFGFFLIPIAIIKLILSSR